MQSVSQYDTSENSAHSRMNRDFWTFTATNPSSSYLNRYHVRFGLAENPAATVRDDNIFALHYAHLAAELWLDSTDGWLAVADGSTQYAMVERFHYEQSKTYPGKASVIFWTNGPEVHLNSDGEWALSSGNEGDSPYYLEAELNSPLCRLRPEETCSFDTEWFPTRTSREFRGVTDAGILSQPLQARRLQNGKIQLTGSFGVFFPGRLLAHFYNAHGSALGIVPAVNVTPSKLVSLDGELTAPENSARVSLHLEDGKGLDRGSLGEVQVGPAENAR
jgi:hypothetical protein